MLTFLGVLYQPMYQQSTLMKPNTRTWIPRLLFCHFKPIKEKKCSGWKSGISVLNTWKKYQCYKVVSNHLLISGFWRATTNYWGAPSLSDFQSKFNDHLADIHWCDNAILSAEVVLFLLCLVIWGVNNHNNPCSEF